MNIIWRSEVTAKDVQAIRAMVTDAQVFSAEEIDVAEELAQDNLTRGAVDYHFILADSEGALAGYSCFGRIPLTDARYDLYWIVVSKKWQGKKVARMLNEQTEAAAQALGGKMLYAETSSRLVYTPAHRFYAANGYKELARLKDFYSDGDDKLIFGKTLTA